MAETSSVIFNKKIRFSFAKAINKEQFIDKLVKFANDIVGFLNNSGCEKIGHINIISTTDGEDYLQINISDCDETPKIKGFLREKFSKISTTLNIIEFGVKKEIIDDKINEEIGNIDSYFNMYKSD